MKKLLIVLAFVYVLSIPASAARLIYKAVLNTDVGLQTPVINTAPYRQIRIYAFWKSGYSRPTRTGDGFATVSAVEGGKSLFGWSFEDSKIPGTLLIDTPPSGIQINFHASGEYVVYVWGS